MDILESFPELRSLGVQRLQALSDAWTRTPKARECAVHAVRISERDGKLYIGFTIATTHSMDSANLKSGEVLFFPTDDLLLFLADNGLSDDHEKQVVRRRVAAVRQKAGRAAFQHFRLNPGPREPVFVTCKTPGCAAQLKTPHLLCRCELLRIPGPAMARCSVCGREHAYTRGDFHFGQAMVELVLRIGQQVDLDGVGAVVLDLYPSGRPKSVKTHGILAIGAGTYIASLGAVVTSNRTVFEGDQHSVIELSDG